MTMEFKIHLSNFFKHWNIKTIKSFIIVCVITAWKKEFVLNNIFIFPNKSVLTKMYSARLLAILLTHHGLSYEDLHFTKRTRSSIEEYVQASFKWASRSLVYEPCWTKRMVTEQEAVCVRVESLLIYARCILENNCVGQAIKALTSA